MRAIRKGWLKTREQKEQAQAPPVYLLWGDDGQAGEGTTKTATGEATHSLCLVSFFLSALAALFSLAACPASGRTHNLFLLPFLFQSLQPFLQLQPAQHAYTPTLFGTTALLALSQAPPCCISVISATWALDHCALPFACLQACHTSPPPSPACQGMQRVTIRRPSTCQQRCAMKLMGGSSSSLGVMLGCRVPFAEGVSSMQFWNSWRFQPSNAALSSQLRSVKRGPVVPGMIIIPAVIQL